MQPPALGQPVPASNSEAQVAVPHQTLFFFLLLPLSHILQLSYPPPKVDTVFHQPQLCFLSQFVQNPRGKMCCFTGAIEMKKEPLPLGSRQQGQDTKRVPKPAPCSKAPMVSSAHFLESLSLMPQICSLLKDREPRGCGRCGNPNVGVQTP